MQGLFSRPFNSLDENNLRDLVDVRRVREHIHLDYKEESYDHGHTGTVEMLADVTAMANAQGGYILIGVEEDKTEPDGTPKQIIGIENGDTEATWIQSVCLSSIDEKITGLRVRDILLTNGRSCVIIQVPNSVRKPHMIVHKGHRSFRIRHGRSKSPMGMQEVRNMILSMNAYHTSLENFIEDRRQNLRDLAKEAPWLLLMATPIYVDRDKIDPLRNDIRDLLRRTPGLPDRSCEGIHAGIPEPTLFGIEASHRDKKILRLFRNGHLEYCENHSAIDYRPKKAIPIHSYRMTVTLLHFLEVAKQIMQLGEVSEPITITAHWENFNPSYLHRWESRQIPLHAQHGSISFWREHRLSIEFTASELSDTNNLARSVIDRLFNAFGYDHNPHFDADGNFVRQ